MPSITLKTTDKLLSKVADLYEDNRNKEGGKAWCQRNITCKAGNFLSALGFLATSSLDLAFGSVAAIGSILTGGRIKRLNKAACDMTGRGGAGHLLSGPYAGLLSVINPHAMLDMKIDSSMRGILSHIVGEKIKSAGRDLRGSDNKLVKHVLSRITYLGYALTSIVTRIIDLVIGILATPLSFFTLGKFVTINQVAFLGLQGMLIIKDFYYGVLKTIDPWASIN